MIINDKFASFLTGRATSAQIDMLKELGASKRQLAYFLQKSEGAIKRCLRTPGRTINILPTFWMAAPAMLMPKSVGYCVFKYSGKKSTRYSFKLLGVRYDPALKCSVRQYSEIDREFTNLGAIKRWAKGREPFVPNYVRDTIWRYEACKKIIRAKKIPEAELQQYLDAETITDFEIFKNIQSEKRWRREAGFAS